MPSVNLRQLRDTRQLKVWLQAGETVELRERDRVLGRIVPEPDAARPVVWPDFAEGRKRIFGALQIPAVEILIQERESRP